MPVIVPPPLSVAQITEPSTLTPRMNVPVGHDSVTRRCTSLGLIATAPMPVGRAGPPAAPGLNTSVPLLPLLSRHDPPSVAGFKVTSMCAGVAPVEVTIVTPNSKVPSGLGTTTPWTAARDGAPH